MFQRKSVRETFSLDIHGQKLFGMIHKPLLANCKGTLLICHGLGGDKVGRYRGYVTLAEELAERGIATIRFDYRGCGDSEGLFSELTLESQMEDAIAVVSVVDHMVQGRSKQPLPLLLLGRSFGGLVATCVAARFPDLVAGLILWSAVYDGLPWQPLWEAFQQGKQVDLQDHSLMRVNGEPVNLLLFKQLFEIDMRQEIEATSHLPLLHLHGTADEVVSIQHAEAYQKARKPAEAISQFVQFPAADHRFSDSIQRKEAIDLVVAWCDKLLR